MDRPPALVAVCLLLASCGPSVPLASTAPEPATPAGSTSSSASALEGIPPALAASSSARAGAASSAPASPPPPALPAVRVVLVEPTPFSGKPPVLSIVAPAKNLVIAKAKAPAFDVRLSAKQWKPGPGDHLCLVFDKRPCRKVEDATKPIRLGDLGDLDEGQHVVSLLARRASGEFFRPAGKAVPFASVSFFVGKKVPPVHKDGTPMVFFSPPERGPAPADGVLVDFFVANAEVRSSNVVVHASVGGPGIESGVGIAIDANKPLRVTNARAGEYLARMTLMQFTPDLTSSKSVTTVTYTATPVTGPFGEVVRSFFVTK
jgi:hypothetical protein